MKYLIHPAAQREADEAAEWYGERVPHLAVEFARQYVTMIDSIVESPRMFAPADDGPAGVECRAVQRLGRFPYRIVYALDGDDIFVVAVAHHHRRPGYWQTRLTPDPA